MSWQPTRRFGHRVWSGTDSIVDPHKHRRKVSLVGGGCGILIGTGVIAFMMARMAIGFAPEGRAVLFGFLTVVWRDWAGSIVAFLAIGAGLCVLWRQAHSVHIPDGWFCRAWTLRGSENGLSYRAGAFTPELDAAQVGANAWTVELDEIARVESGLTREWQHKRFYPGGPLWATPSLNDGLFFSDGSIPLDRTAEHQTFLYLNDGSRLVVYTANADREGTGRLASSIRSWIEEMRSRPRARDRELDQPGRVARREGYDI